MGNNFENLKFNLHPLLNDGYRSRPLAGLGAPLLVDPVPPAADHPEVLAAAAAAAAASRVHQGRDGPGDLGGVAAVAVAQEGAAWKAKLFLQKNI